MKSLFKTVNEKTGESLIQEVTEAVYEDSVRRSSKVWVVLVNDGSEDYGGETLMALYDTVAQGMKDFCSFGYMDISTDDGKRIVHKRLGMKGYSFPLLMRFARGRAPEHMNILSVLRRREAREVDAKREINRWIFDAFPKGNLPYVGGAVSVPSGGGPKDVASASDVFDSTFAPRGKGKTGAFVYVTLQDNVIPTNENLRVHEADESNNFKEPKADFNDRSSFFRSKDVLYLYKAAHVYGGSESGVEFKAAGREQFLFALKTKLYHKLRAECESTDGAASSASGSKLTKVLTAFLSSEFEGYTEIVERLHEKMFSDDLIGELQQFAIVTEFFAHQLAFGSAKNKNPSKFWQGEQPFVGVYVQTDPSSGSGSGSGSLTMNSFVVPTVSSLAKGLLENSVGQVVSKGENVFLTAAYSDVFMATAIANRPKSFFDQKTFKTVTGEGRFYYVIPAPPKYKKG